MTVFLKFYVKCTELLCGRVLHQQPCFHLLLAQGNVLYLTLFGAGDWADQKGTTCPHSAHASPFAVQSLSIFQSQVQTLSELHLSPRNCCKTQITCLYISCKTNTLFIITAIIALYLRPAILVSALPGRKEQLLTELQCVADVGEAALPGGVLMRATSTPVASLALWSSCSSESYSHAASTA